MTRFVFSRGQSDHEPAGTNGLPERIQKLMRLELAPRTVAMILALWCTLLLNQALWRHVTQLYEVSNAPWVLYLVLAALLVCGNFLWLMLFAWRPLRKIVWSLTLLAAANAQFYMLRYGVLMDKSMLRNILDTNPGEAWALLTPALLLHVVLFAGLPIFWLWCMVRFVPASAKRSISTSMAWIFGVIAATGILVAASYASVKPAVQTHKTLRYLMNPLASLVSWNSVVIKPLLKPQKPLNSINAGAQLGSSYSEAANTFSKPPLVILVVGETTRGDHFSLNGYARKTNSDLATKQVLSWTQARSCGTSTNVSVPCMFSHQEQKHFQRLARNDTNLLDMLQTVGLAVNWLDNQAGCQGVCARIPYLQADHIASPEAVHMWCTDGECLDRLMVEVLDEQLNSLPESARARGAVLVLHQMGSHGPSYYRRSAVDTKRFQPECRNDEIASCSREALVNAYDNSMAETDRFLAQTIEWLQTKEEHFATSMLYVADHGESLGEEGVYMHAAPYDFAPNAQTQVPWVWWPGTLVQRNRIDTACVAQRVNQLISHDNYFHTVLGMLDVHTPYYEAQLDLLAPCRAQRS